MMEKMIALQQKRRSKKGGFTLVELIVVLVILAILAALLIPALTGYIDKAKEKSITAECRQVVMAAQTLYDEKYGTISTDATTFPSFSKDKTADDGIVIAYASVASLAEVEVKNITDIEVTTKSSDKAKNNKISKVVYEKNGKTCEYKDNQYTVK